MADYFAALAARTLRPELSVQPRQRVRWEEGLESTTLSSPLADRQMIDAERASASDNDEPVRRPRRKPSEARNEEEHERVERRPKQRVHSGKAVVHREETTEAIAAAPHPTVRAVEPTVEVRFERVVTRQIDAPGKSSVASRDRAETTARLDGGRARPLSTRPSTPERTAEPVIRIHIGRVDVRAVTSAAPGPSPSAARDSKRELMSIDEYLQKRDRGAS